MLYELILFAAIGFAIGGLDDLLVDLLWIGRTIWRRATIYRRHPRTTIASLAPSTDPGPIAVFIPAWNEANVIDAMLGYCTKAWDGQECQIYVGCYLNDLPSQMAVASVRDPRIRLVVVPHFGPTNKSDCLNHIWRQLKTDEMLGAPRFKCVILHDAEDVVHADELTLFSRMIDRFAMVQIPVLPFVDPKSRWIGGHYIDEFAEAHAKGLVVREAVGAAIPAAGVGCAIRRDALDWLALRHDNNPFGAESLTEDYELGLQIRSGGFKGVFVRMMGRDGTDPVAVRAHFPATLTKAVNQKSRWILGIALAGWDRLGWEGDLIESWMRLRDRRAILAAIIIVAGYVAGLIALAFWLLGWPLPQIGAGLRMLLTLNGLLLIWRLVMRASFVTASYGWREGLFAIPRALISNLVAVLAARRALSQYLRLYRAGGLTWEKTDHIFPDLNP